MSRFGLLIFVLLMVGAAPARAQGAPQSGPQNLDAGKSAAQIFTSDCGICHKSPQGLVRSGMFGLEGFLREHYTASKESAAAMAKFLRAAGEAAAPAKTRGKQPAKGDAKKPGDAKPTGKPEDTKPAEQSKPEEAKPSEAKPAETKLPETKPSDTKVSEPKPTETKPADEKPASPKSE